MKLVHQTNPIDEVTALAVTVKEGNTLRVTCPKCCGGVSQEKNSLAISKGTAGKVFFKCFRAKCNWGGSVQSGNPLGANPSAQTRLPRIFDRPVEELNDLQIQWYREKFSVSPDKDTVYCPSKDMYAFKVFGPNGETRGWHLRSFVPGAAVRALNYNQREESFISWYLPKQQEIGGVVVVEDIPSARKVSSCGITSVALLGCSIDFERAYEIAGKCENFVILALDRGTLAHQIAYRQRYEPLWGSVEIWQLQEDLKYVDRTRIREAIFDGKSDFISVHSK
jgi:hypothetical protein